MNTFEGVCKHCGSMINIMAINQEDANKQAEDNCQCGGAEREHKYQMIMFNLEGLIGKRAAENNFKEAEECVQQAVAVMAELVLDQKVSKVTVNLDHSTLNIIGTAKGVKTERTKTRKVTTEA